MDTDCKDFLEYLEYVARRSDHTLRSYRTSLELYGQSLGEHGVERVRDATFGDVCAFVAELAREGKAPRTVALRLAAVRSLHRWLQVGGRAAVNPAEPVPAPRIGRDSRRAHTLGQVEQVRAHLGGTGPLQRARNRALFDLSYGCALRIHEVQGARLDWLRLEVGELDVFGKGGKLATVPVDERTAGSLRSWLELRPTRRAPWIFPGRSRHGQVSYATIDRVIRGAAAAAGFDPVSWHHHSLRKARAEHLRAAGADPFVIRSLLRHERLDETATYVEPPIADLRAAILRASRPASPPRALAELVAELSRAIEHPTPATGRGSLGGQGA